MRRDRVRWKQTKERKTDLDSEDLLIENAHCERDPKPTGPSMVWSRAHFERAHHLRRGTH